MVKFVKSIIKSNLSYPETTQISTKDIGLENVQAYEVKLLDIPLFVILGSIDYTYQISDGVVYTPIYLLNPKNNKVSKKIGIYEIESDDIPKYVDSNDSTQLTLESLTDKVPLFFSFVSETFLKSFKKLTIKEKKSKIDSTQINTKPTDFNITDETDKTKKTDVTDVTDEVDEADETNETDETFKLKEQIIDGTLEWVAYYFNDTKFSIKDNDGGGDCFFLSIKQAYDTIAKSYSVTELRNIVADNFTHDLFNAYQEIIQSYDNKIAEERKKLDQIDNEISVLGDAMSNSTQVETKKDIQNKLLIQKQNKISVKKELQDAIQEKNDSMNDVTLPYKMISRTPTLGMLREEIKKSGGDYWADQNGINILEKILNIKFIIFEKTTRDNNVFISNPNKYVTITCSKNDAIDTPTFDPDHYILIEFIGFGHYRLIKYNRGGIFPFSELPDIVKDKVVNNCLESLETHNSAFHIIPDFLNYIKKQLDTNPPKHHVIPEGSNDSPVNSQDAINSCINGLCDDSVIFIFRY